MRGGAARGRAARRRASSCTSASARRRCARPAAMFDVVSARTETYARPGALPDVRPGATIAEDLARRDFTVNAIALRLADGALAEWPGARERPGRGRAAGAARALVRGRPDAAAAPGPLRRAARLRARPGDGRAGRRRATVDTVSRRRGWGRSCGCCCASRSPRRCWRSSATGSGGRWCTRRSRWTAGWSSARWRCARPTRARTSWRWRRRSSAARATGWRGARPARVRRPRARDRREAADGAAPREALERGPADGGARRRRGCGARCGGARRRRSRWRARCGAPRRRPALARRRPPPAAGDHRRRLRGRRPERPGGRRRARRGAARGAGRAGARRRDEQLAAGLAAVRALVASSGMDRPTLPPPFRWEGEHVAAELPGARRAVLDPPRRRLAGAVRLAEPRPPDRRRRRQRGRQPRAAGRGGRAAARALPVRPPGPRRHACGARPSRPGAARPAADEDGQATALRRRRRARVRRRLPAGAAGRRRRRGGAARRLARRWRAGSSRRACARCASSAPTGPIAAAIGAGARGCCYEVGEEVHAHFAESPARARASATSTCRPSPARSSPRRASRRSTTSGLCTMCRNDLFFSHRADGGVTGRQAGVVWRA